jgi:hypothetical protein
MYCAAQGVGALTNANPNQSGAKPSCARLQGDLDTPKPHWMISMSSTSRLIFAGFLLTTLLAVSCGSCESCEPAEEPETRDDAGATEPTQADVVEDTYGQMLEEATRKAKLSGDQTAFDRVTKARFMAAELEGLQKEQIDAPKVKGSPKPKYDDNGQLDVRKLKQVFRRNQSALRKCYERGLKADPALRGKVTLTVRIGSGGKASLVKARSKEIASSTALDCMERAAKSWSYPSPTGGTVLVTKGFEFTPES